jgi:hypothetical protein
MLLTPVASPSKSITAPSSNQAKCSIPVHKIFKAAIFKGNPPLMNQWSSDDATQK